MKATISYTDHSSHKRDVEISTLDELKELYDKENYSLIIDFYDDGMCIEVYNDYRE